MHSSPLIIQLEAGSSLSAELKWLNSILEGRQNLIAKKKDLPYKSIYEIEPPLLDDGSFYAQIVNQHKLSFEERVILALAIAPHIDPSLLDIFKYAGAPPALGGHQFKNHRGFIASGETVIFLLAGTNTDRRLEVLRHFDQDHVFSKKNILRLGYVEQGEPRLAGALIVPEDIIDLITLGKKTAPAFGHNFPAKKIQTDLEWDDLVLSPQTINQLNELKLWLKHSHTLRADISLGKRMKPGYKALFHGPPGTGKTLAANLLGKEMGRDVYRIDLSQIVSKYIGETEKNLAKVFDKAEHSDWILFFDEADALFGSRTNVSSSHDRYANQEVSYLLQRIEEYDGMVLLASNLKNNIDHAFLRRFQSIVHFPMPKPDERIRLWKKGFQDETKLESDVDLNEIARAYELSGAHINNIIIHCNLLLLGEGLEKVNERLLKQSIMRELAKEGRTF